MSVRDVFDGEHEVFRDAFATFLEREVTVAPTVAAVFAAAGAAGFLGMQIPEEFGGGGVLDSRFGAAASEEFARTGLFGLGLAFTTHVDVAIPALLTARTEQRARWLPGLAAGACIAAVTEGTAHYSERPGGYQLDGVVPGVNAESAGLLLIPATGTTGDPVLAVLDPATPGVRRDADPEPMGIGAAGMGSVSLAGVEVGENELIRGEVVARLRVDQQLSAAVLAVAGARTVLDWALEYVRGRKVFGRPVASFENTRYALASVYGEILRAEALVDTCLRERTDDRPIPHRVAAAKLGAAEVFGQAADQALQLHGGYGYMREYPIAQAYADARFFRLYAGSTEAVRQVLATELGLPR